MLCDVLETFLLMTGTLSHDAIVKRNVGVSSVLLVHFKTLRGFVGYVEAFGFAAGGQEDMVFDGGVHGLAEDWFELNAGDAVYELRGAWSSYQFSVDCTLYVLTARPPPPKTTADEIFPSQRTSPLPKNEQPPETPVIVATLEMPL